MKRIFKAISVLFLVCLLLMPLSACRSGDKKKTDANTERTTDCPDGEPCPDDEEAPENPDKDKQPHTIPKWDLFPPEPPEEPPFPPVRPLPFHPFGDEEDPIYRARLPFDRIIDEYRP